MATEQNPRSLYAGDLPPDVTKDFLQRFFSEIGTVEDISLKTDRRDRKGRPIAYAFVTFSNHDAAKRALTELNYTKLNSVAIRLSWCDPITNRIRKSAIGNVFIKNLDPSIEVAQLHDALGNFGEIISCKIATDDQGKSLGYGYVQFREEKDAEQAMVDLKDATINGRAVHIEPYRKIQRQNPEETYTNVYIRNLPESVVDQESFRRLIEDVWPDALNHIADTETSPQPKLMLDDSGKSRAFGFCLMKDHESAVTLVEKLNGRQVGEMEVQSGRAKSRDERMREIEEASAKWRKAMYEKYKDRNLYVRGFDESLTDEKLNELFSQYGQVESARVMTADNEKGEKVSKKFGFVCFVNKEDAEKCLKESILLHFPNGGQAYVANAIPAEQRKRATFQSKKPNSAKKDNAHLPIPSGMSAYMGYQVQGLPQQQGEHPEGGAAGMPNMQMMPGIQMPGMPMPGMQMPGMQMQGMPMGAMQMPGMPMMAPYTMGEVTPRDMIKGEIQERFGNNSEKVARLKDLSDDQCKNLIKDQDLLTQWLGGQ